jgi:uncharacterized lipoprotein YmbA
MRIFVACGLLLVLGACASTQQQQWDMYRLDKHYRPYRVVVPTESADTSESPDTSEAPHMSLKYKARRSPR